MATSAELKKLIVEKIKAEWDDPGEGAEWKAGKVLNDKLFKEITATKNWKRFYKKKSVEGDTVFVVRMFSIIFDDGESELMATVTCDENDNFLEDGIEFDEQELS